MHHSVALILAIGALAACSTKQADAPASAPVTTGSPAKAQDELLVPGVVPGAAPRTRVATGGGACAKDEDCVPASCCHAAACVARASAPACRDVMCTQECKGGTIDCGGGCLCQDGQCGAKIVDSP